MKKKVDSVGVQSKCLTAHRRRPISLGYVCLLIEGENSRKV